MRTGDWIATYTGRRWFITDPHPDDVHIYDIAHGLSLVCRFGGHCRQFYSVAQHSLLCAQEAALRFPDDPDFELWALLHDATEAYLGDMVRPLKTSMPNYKTLERHTELVIMNGLDFTPVSDDVRRAVKEIDDAALMTERRDLITHCGHEWTPRAKPLPGRIEPMGPTEAEALFLAKFIQVERRARAWAVARLAA